MLLRRVSRTMLRIAIPTYNRSEMCRRTVYDVMSEAAYADVHIYLDGGTHYDWHVLGTKQHSLAKTPGRENYYKVWNKILDDARRSEWEFFLALPDDFVPAHPMPIANCIGQLATSGADALVPVVDKRGRGPCWVPMDPVKERYWWHTGWLDGCFICTRETLAALDWIVPKFKPDHFETNQSSGVGKYISLALHRMGKKIYQVEDSLYQHGDHDSVMHYEERKRNPL